MYASLAAGHRLLILAAPTPTSTAPPGAANFLTILGYTLWGVSLVGVLGFLVVAGGMMLSHRRGEGGTHGAALGWVSAGCVLAASAGPIATGFGL